MKKISNEKEPSHQADPSFPSFASVD